MLKQRSGPWSGSPPPINGSNKGKDVDHVERDLNLPSGINNVISHGYSLSAQCELVAHITQLLLEESPRSVFPTQWHSLLHQLGSALFRVLPTATQAITSLLG